MIRSAPTSVVTDKTSTAKNAESSLQGTENLSEQGAGLEAGLLAGFSSAKKGFNLGQIPAKPGLQTGLSVQCCAKDGGSCSCPKCKAKAEKEKEQEEYSENLIQSVEETSPQPEASAPEAAGEQSQAQQPETEETPAEPAETSPSLIVEDSEADVANGQMKKTEFLQQLRESICATIEPVLATAGQTTEGCPYLNYWLNLYQDKSANEVESTVRRYAPDAASATSAGDYISIVTQRALSAAQTWAATGRISGVPSDLQATAPTAGRAPESASPPAQSITPVMTKAKDGGGRNTADALAIQKELGEGQPLDPQVRSRMESAFGASFSNVRTHTNSTASTLSNSVNARAFTVGSHVAFGAGEYQPGTVMGDALIAHELAHVLQQNGSGESVEKMEPGSTGYDELEKDADNAATGVVTSLWGGLTNGLQNFAQRALPKLRSGLRIQGCPDDSPRRTQQQPQQQPQQAGCIHPVNFRSTQTARNLDFGLRMRVNWDSSTGNLADLAGCHVTEYITYSTINNPPFGRADGRPLPESGISQRIPALPGVDARDGQATDTHRHPRALVRTPPTADSYTVTQTYDYNCPACGGTWVPSANYVITYRIYNDNGTWKFGTRKTGTDGPFTSDETI